MSLMSNEVSLASPRESTSSSSSSPSPPFSPLTPPLISISPTPWTHCDSADDEPSKSPNITDSLGNSTGIAAAQFGYYDIRHIVGVQKVKFQGKVRKLAEVEWCRSLVDFDNIETYDQDSIPYGISFEAKELLKNMDPKASFYVEQTYLCRFCKTTFYSRSDGIQHEKVCTVPGGPGHKCKSACLRTCRGRVVYVPKSTKQPQLVRKSFRFSQTKPSQKKRR